MPSEHFVLDAASFPAVVDISAVQASHDEADVRRLAGAAVQHGFVSAHVLGHWVPLLRQLLEGSATRVGAPVGFPSGGTPSALKVAEAQQLLRSGAQDIDVMINVGRLLSGQDGYVRDELRAVSDAVAGAAGIKVIIEVAYLGPEQVRRACEAACSIAPSHVKTATGWAARPTSVEDVRLVRRCLPPEIGVKAAGGIHDVGLVQSMLEAGATRFGIGAASALELLRRLQATAQDGPQRKRNPPRPDG